MQLSPPLADNALCLLADYLHGFALALHCNDKAASLAVDQYKGPLKSYILAHEQQASVLASKKEKHNKSIFLAITLDRKSNECIVHPSNAGWSSLVARRAHNPKVVGSNPAPATKMIKRVVSIRRQPFFIFSLLS